MQWHEVCENPSLQNIPFKIELNAQGQLLMSPVKVNHSLIQGKIISLLYQHIRKGEAPAGCAIKTKKGTKIANVAWASQKILDIIQSKFVAPISFSVIGGILDITCVRLR